MLAKACAGLLASACALLIAGTAARAQDFPWKPVRLIVPFAAGGPVDVLARALGERFKELTGQAFIVDNKPGGSTISLNPFLFANLSYDPQKDLEPLTNVVFTQQVMILHRSIAANTLRELVVYAKQNPDKLNFGSFGIGGDSHLVFEWLKAKTGVQMAHIPYGGAAPALLAFERGDAHLLFPVASPAVLERVKSGLAKPIAVPEGQQAPALLGVPSFSASGLPPYDAKTWFGAFAPAGTPKARVEELARHLAAVVKSQTFQERFIKLGGYDAVGNTPEAFRNFLAEDRLRGQELVRIAGVKIAE
jgi:tripartite-type tricarboxylate transporter receptor subunit TctC